MLMIIHLVFLSAYVRLVVDADEVVGKTLDDRSGFSCLNRCLVDSNKDGLFRLDQDTAIALENMSNVCHRTRKGNIHTPFLP